MGPEGIKKWREDREYERRKEEEKKEEEEKMKVLGELDTNKLQQKRRELEKVLRSRESHESHTEEDYELGRVERILFGRGEDLDKR